MKLKQEDRNLLHDFFTNQSEWMRNNSLRSFKNLSEFKKRFLEFTKDRDCEDNMACKLFELALEHELLKCEGEIKRVKLNYRPVTQEITDNPAILKWVEEASIAYEVSFSHVEAVDKSIQQKVRRNETEIRASYEVAKDFIVKNS